ncbi:hypothetical protein D3C85_1579930 [compost metagenome]
MGEVDDAQQTEDDCQSQTQERVERTVDQAQQQLAEHCCQGNPEYRCHCQSSSSEGTGAVRP